MTDGGQGGAGFSYPPREDFIGDGGVLPQAELPAQDSDSWLRFMIVLYRNVARQRLTVCVCMWINKKEVCLRGVGGGQT